MSMAYKIVSESHWCIQKDLIALIVCTSALNTNNMAQNTYLIQVE